MKTASEVCFSIIEKGRASARKLVTASDKGHALYFRFEPGMEAGLVEFPQHTKMGAVQRKSSSCSFT